LTELGWSLFFQQQLTTNELAFLPARVFRQDTNQYHLLSARGKMVGVLPGKFRQDALSKADLPTVGDWVLVSPIDNDETDRVQIEKLLERKSKFSRKEAGEIHDEQVVASNIDTVFIVSALDKDFNLHRIERYLLLSWTSGARPVLVLNKSDVCKNIEKKVRDLEVIAMGSPIHVMSARDHRGIGPLRGYLTPGSTCAFLGSSGVGKSTIINELLGYKKFGTGEVRSDDSRGRHTTTFREMVEATGGGMIIDTPGMREIQLWANNVSLAHSFQDIESLAASCKFFDCKHDTEPNCSITNAVSKGDLEPERLARYFRLTQELEKLARQQNTASRARKKQQYKRFSKLSSKKPIKKG
jgi:ribosome biogenesis GTPase